jgi:hypothetical protein
MFSVKKKEKSKEVTRNMGIVPIFLVAVVALVFGAAVPDCWAQDGMEFKDAEFFIEYNSTAGDTGVQVFLDDDNWRKITITDPNNRIIFDVKGMTALGRQGLTELFFESVEPELAALPIVTFLQRFPEGDYEFKGLRNDRVKLESDAEFTHVIPCGPAVLPEEGTAMLNPDSDIIISWDEVDEVVNPAATDSAEETVCTDPVNLEQELEIDSYQVIVENEDIDIIVNLPAEAGSLTVPSELIEENTAYKFEVLAKEESGNQTITESSFCTGPILTKDECEALLEAL